jgi:hypothetical protein
VANPARILYVGFILIGLSAIGITTLKQTTPHAVLIAYLIGSGLGLGFVLPNLTIFAQQTAGRAHLGIATAMIQSLRMVGGMIGTALVGTLVNHLYLGQIRTALEQAQASQWFPGLHDPQILINKAAQSDFAGQATAAGQNGAALIELARTSLVASIHFGQMLSVLVVLGALWQMRRLPPLQLKR